MLQAFLCEDQTEGFAVQKVEKPIDNGLSEQFLFVFACGSPAFILI